MQALPVKSPSALRSLGKHLTYQLILTWCYSLLLMTYSILGNFSATGGNAVAMIFHLYKPLSAKTAKQFLICSVPMSADEGLIYMSWCSATVLQSVAWSSAYQFLACFSVPSALPHSLTPGTRMSGFSECKRLPSLVMKWLPMYQSVSVFVSHSLWATDSHTS